MLSLTPAGSVLVGWSMGGKIALAAAAKPASRLRALVLVSPSPPGPEPMEPGAREQALVAYGDREAARREVESLVAAPLSPARLEEAVAEKLASDAGAWRWWLERGSRETVSTAAVDLPVLVVAGAEDPHLGPDVQRALTLPHVPDAELAVLEGVGHFAPLERPDVLASRLEAWLRTLGNP